VEQIWRCGGGGVRLRHAERAGRRCGTCVLLFVRPVCAGLNLIGVRILLREATVISSFGVRGLGSFYYIAVALGLADFGEPRTLWMTSCLVVLLSIVMHGVSVTPIMW
jgi:sodium/hydrogen antiporter